MPTLSDILGGCLPGACGNNPPVPSPAELLGYALALLICGCVLLGAAIVFALLRGTLGGRVWRSKRVILSATLGCIALVLAYRAQGAYEYFAHTPGAWPSSQSGVPSLPPPPVAATGYALAAMLMVVLAAMMGAVTIVMVVGALLRVARRGAHATLIPRA